MSNSSLVLDKDESPTATVEGNEGIIWPEERSIAPEREKQHLNGVDAAGNAERPVSAPPSPPPDGGFRAWSAVAGGFCAMFVSLGWINCACQVVGD